MQPAVKRALAVWEIAETSNAIFFHFKRGCRLSDYKTIDIPNIRRILDLGGFLRTNYENVGN